MSPRKLTEDDKQEILQLYRSSEATTSTLATRYEVSSSTISRFLKNKLSSTEYEDLIQQKRLARTPRGEKTKEKPAKSTKSKKTASKTKPVVTVEPDTQTVEPETLVTESDTQTVEPETLVTEPDTQTVEPETLVTEPDTQTVEPETPVAEPDTQTVEPAIAQTETETPSKPVPTRRRRRRASAPEPQEEVTTIEPQEKQEELETEKPEKLIIETKAKDTPQVAVDSDRISKSNSLILKNDRVDEEDDEDDEDEDDEVDIITLKEMLGEDLEDINEDEDDEDDDWEDEEEIITYSRKGSDYSDIQILPLSQATFPRTCYLVIDRSAELIVKPLADFADLGEIPQEEIKERTLPVFDNHRIAKRFSHRRERVIKVPDGRMLQKTSQYLQEKGITRLLIDGQIYSLSS